MNFFESVSANPNATFETLEKQRVAWNKGLSNSTGSAGSKNKGKPSPRKGKPSSNKGKPSPIKGKPSPIKGRQSPTKGMSINGKPVMTPIGLFLTTPEAAKAIGVHPSTIGYWMKTHPKEFYRIKVAQ